MGLKAGLQILQQTGKAVANYADDAARLTVTPRENLAKAVTTKNSTLPIYMRKALPADNIEGIFETKLDFIGDTVEIAIIHKSPKINLTNELRKQHYSRNELQQLFNSNHHMQKIVGSLPRSWGKILKSRNGIENVDTIFSKFIDNIHSGIKESDAINALEKELQFLLQTKVKVSSLGSGTFGKVYKIEVDSRNFVLKTFKIDCTGTSTNQSGWAELSNAIYASNKTKNVAKFYMGKFGKTDTDTYMLTRYIDSADSDLKGFIKSSECRKGNGFKMVDIISKFDIIDETPSNYIGWKIVDYGLMIETEFGKMPHKSYKILRQMCEAADTKSYKKMQHIAEQYKNTPELKEAVDAFVRAIDYAEELTHKKSNLREIIEMLECFGYNG